MEVILFIIFAIIVGSDGPNLFSTVFWIIVGGIIIGIFLAIVGCIANFIDHSDKTLQNKEETNKIHGEEERMEEQFIIYNEFFK